jgi:transposase
MKPWTESNRSSPVVIGVDIGKEVFHLVGLAIDGKIAFRRRIRRLALKDVFEKLPACIVGMEACLSAHFVSRTPRALGHEPRIVPAIYVKPFVKGQKNDYNDAEAIAEASVRGSTLRQSGCTGTSSPSHWPTSSRASPGACCATTRLSIPAAI